MRPIQRQCAVLVTVLVSLVLPVAGQVAAWCLAPPLELRPGDLVFRRGQGIWSGQFAGLSSRETRFSHVGVVWAVDGEVKIVHAEASEWTGHGRVRETTWRGFFEDAGARECAVFRFDGPPETAMRLAERAHERIGVPFDSGFDLSETNRLYCTELIAVALAEATGADGSPRTSRGERTYIALDDLYSRGFSRVYDSEVPAGAGAGETGGAGDE